MSRALRHAAAAVVAAVVETGSLWVLTHAVELRPSVAFAAAFAAGYVTLFAAIRVLRHSAMKAPLGAQLRAAGLFGIAALLLVEVIVYVCVDWLHLNLTVTNATAVAAVVCWLALGWGFVSVDAQRSPSGRWNVSKREA
jgi:hypothetical protein